MPFQADVEVWRPLFDARGGDVKTDYYLDWVDRESSGNPCNLETATGSDESGLLQLMTPHDLEAAGTSEDRTHPVPPCVAGRNSRVSINDLTDAQVIDQVDDSVAFVATMRQRAHDALDAVGSNWPEQSIDFWALVRLMHALPAAAGGLQVAAAQLGRGPASWDEFTQYVSQTPGYVPGWQHWLDVAYENGQWGEGGGGGSSWVLALAGLVGLAAGVWFYRRRAHRGIAVGV